MTCTNNLKQIGLAMHNYAQAYKCFPPAYIADKNGKPMHSWRVLILPYLEEQALYAQYRFNEPWNSPHNKALADQMPPVYRCPSEGDSNRSETSYAMLVGPHAISDGPTPRRFSDIKDGTSNTIMVAECARRGINWLEPRDLKTNEMTSTSTMSEATGSRASRRFPAPCRLGQCAVCDVSMRTFRHWTPRCWMLTTMRWREASRLRGPESALGGA